MTTCRSLRSQYWPRTALIISDKKIIHEDNMKQLGLIIILIALSSIALGDCIEINGKNNCDKGGCVEVDGGAYCSKYEGGEAVVHNGLAYCGAGKCANNNGHVYCSQFPGGGIVENNKTLWTGKGECLIYNTNAYCSSEKQGKCVIENGSVKCQGGWMREKAMRAERCIKTVGINP